MFQTNSIRLIGFTALTFILASCGDNPEPKKENMMDILVSTDQSGPENFDFLKGEWKVMNRRLKERLAGSNEWIEFEARLFGYRKFLGGNLNIENFEAEFNGKAFYGSSIRTFNPQKGEWTIYWVDSNNHEVLPQVKGTFNNGIGEFFGEDQVNGKAVKLRFLWKDVTKDRAVWEQAYFDESRGDWETNWTMEFIRIDPSDS